MNKQDTLLLYQYNQWANAKILRATTNVTAEQFIAPAPFPHGGLHGTLVHALSAQWIWRTRWEGTSPTFLLDPKDFPTVESLLERWAVEEKQLMDFVANISDDRLNNTFRYTNTKGQPFTKVLWHAMLHVVNHSTQHRSEAAAILTDLGHSPGDLDMILFLE